MGEAAGRGAAGDPLWHRRQGRAADLCRWQEELHRHQGVRRRDRQSQPPHAADGKCLDARGTGQVPDRAAVRDLRRRAAQARGAGGEDRGRGHLDVHPPFGGRRAGVVLHAGGEADRPAAPDRQGHPQGNQRAAGLPQQRRARLPQSRSHVGHAVGRRKPAHPPGQPDRFGPLGRALRARRTLDRPAPAR